MKVWKATVACIAVVSIAVSVLTILYLNYELRPIMPNLEKISIQNAKVADNNLLLYVSARTDVNITKAVIWNNDGIVIDTIPINIIIQQNQSMTLTLNASLTSGNYTIILETAKGSSFCSKISI